MKVLINCSFPFCLAHGGQQIQVQRTMDALAANGVEVEPLRWWDDQQKGDLIHYFGRMPADHIRFAHKKGMKVVMGELLTGPGSRTMMQQRLQKLTKAVISRLAPAGLINSFNWDSYRLADTIVAMTPWEQFLMTYQLGGDPAKIVIVPNGVEDVFLTTPATERGKWLVCTATITERKRVLELAEAAVRAQTPLWVIGKAYAENDPYAQRFYALARQNPQLICTDSPPMADRAGLAKIYRAARGFVLLSAMETRSLAAEEAAACECPLLLSDLPWARSTYEGLAAYAPITNDAGAAAAALRQFYDRAPTLPLPPRPPNWHGIGALLKGIYARTLSA